MEDGGGTKGAEGPGRNVETRRTAPTSVSRTAAALTTGRRCHGGARVVDTWSLPAPSTTLPHTSCRSCLKKLRFCGMLPWGYRHYCRRVFFDWAAIYK